MSAGILTETGRQKILKAHAGDMVLPKIVQIGFGSGGVDQNGNVREITGSEETLWNELLRKDIEKHTYPEDIVCRYEVRLTNKELSGAKISELGLFDESGDMVAYKNFLQKGKDDDMEFVFYMDEIL